VLSPAVAAGETLSARNRVVEVFSSRFPAQCRQCEDAPCVKVCPTGATYRTETYTAVNPKLCIACKLCRMDGAHFRKSDLESA
jgi:Fe-S-cluster-containing hydrogenase component 2